MASPGRLTVCLENRTDVCHLRLQFYHLCIEARQEENVVDKCQQVFGIITYFADKQLFILNSVALFEEIGKSYHRMEWCTNLVAHIVKEGILHQLHLLGFAGLESQGFLHRLHITIVTTHAEIADHLAVGIYRGIEREMETERISALDVQDGLERCVNWLARTVVHRVKSSLGLTLRLVVEQGKATCLSETILHATNLAVNHHCMGVRRIISHAQAAILQDEVDVTDIGPQLVVSLFELCHIPA